MVKWVECEVNMKIELENNERLLLLKHVNAEIQKAHQKQVTVKRWEMLYSLQAKLTKQTTGQS